MILLLSALDVLSISNCADACVDIYRVDKYGERRFCWNSLLPYYVRKDNFRLPIEIEKKILNQILAKEE